MRNINFENGEYYHIFNRGVDKRDIFCCDKDFVRFIKSIRHFNQIESIGSIFLQTKAEPLSGSKSHLEALVEILCYSLLSNHYHFLIKQISDNGIPKFFHKLGMGYTHYFNNKYNRSGSLFQGTYKAIHIKSDSQLLRLSSYINDNSEVHKVSNAENYPWSSYQDYLEKRNGTICNKEILLDEFENINEYKKFTKDIIIDSQEIKNELNLFRINEI